MLLYIVIALYISIDDDNNNMDDDVMYMCSEYYLYVYYYYSYCILFIFAHEWLIEFIVCVLFSFKYSNYFFIYLCTAIVLNINLIIIFFVICSTCSFFLCFSSYVYYF